MLHTTTKEMRMVIVKVTGKPPKVACVVREGADIVVVRLSLGYRKFAPASRRVTPAQVLRDATPRERELGFVPT